MLAHLLGSTYDGIGLLKYMLILIFNISKSIYHVLLLLLNFKILC